MPPHSDITTLANDREYNRGSIDHNRHGPSDEGSISIQFSASNKEFREKTLRKLTKVYGSHIKKLKQQHSYDGKLVRVTNA